MNQVPHVLKGSRAVYNYLAAKFGKLFIDIHPWNTFRKKVELGIVPYAYQAKAGKGSLPGRHGTALVFFAHQVEAWFNGGFTTGTATPNAATPGKR